MLESSFGGVRDVPEGVRPHGDAAGVVDRPHGLGDGGRLAQAEGRAALDQIGPDQRADVVDALVPEAGGVGGAGEHRLGQVRSADRLPARSPRRRSRARRARGRAPAAPRPCASCAARGRRGTRLSRSPTARTGVVDAVAEDVQFAGRPAPAAPSSTAEISTAGTTRTPRRSPASSASETPLTVSWSDSASSSTPASPAQRAPPRPARARRRSGWSATAGRSAAARSGRVCDQLSCWSRLGCLRWDGQELWTCTAEAAAQARTAAW